MSASVEKAQSNPSNPSHVSSIKLKDGTSIPADLVILGVGVSPATEFLKNSDLELQKDGSLKVDKYLRVVGVEDVYATGTDF